MTFTRSMTVTLAKPTTREGAFSARHSSLSRTATRAGHRLATKPHALLQSLLLTALLISAQFPLAANAAIVFDWENPCFNDCVAVGVIDNPITTVSGSLTLDLPSAVIANTWDASDVLAFSFVFDTFEINQDNSSLNNAGITPFTTTASNPFADELGHLVAVFDADPSISLVIAMGGLNLVQPGAPVCNTGSCQTQSLGPYTRMPAVPIPATLPLLLSAVAGLSVVRNRRN